jgi:hypothetical protein
MSTMANDEGWLEAEVEAIFGPRAAAAPRQDAQRVMDDPEAVPMPAEWPASPLDVAGPIRVESRSAPGTFHEVRREGGALTCDCRGFSFRKTCRHIREVEAALRAGAQDERVEGGEI